MAVIQKGAFYKMKYKIVGISIVVGEQSSCKIDTTSKILHKMVKL